MSSAPPNARRYAPVLALLVMITALLLSASRPELRFLLDRLATWCYSAAQGLVVLAACTGFGLWALPRRSGEVLSKTEISCLALASGVAITSCFILILGITGLTKVAWAWGLIALGIIAAWARCRKMPLPPRPNSASPDKAHPLIIIALLTTIIIMSLAWFTPPLLFDVTEYHLGAWRDYQAQTQAPRFTPSDNFYARFPFPIESLYFLSLMAFPGYDAGPKFINAAMVLGTAALVWILAGRLGARPTWSAIAALLALCHPAMLEVSIDAYIDAGVAFLLLASVLAFLTPQPAPKKPSLLPAAMLCFGGALAAKYTTMQLYLLPIAALFAGPALWRAWQKGHKKTATIALAAGATLLLFWLGKNIAFYGNPFEPFFLSWFRPNDLAAAAREKFYINSHYPQAFWSLNYWTSLFPRLLSLELIWLAPLAAWITMHPSRPATKLLLAAALAYLSWNLVRESQVRFMLPAIAWLVAVGCAGVCQLEPWALRRTVGAIMLLACAATLLVHAVRVSGGKSIDYLLNYTLEPLSPTPADPESPVTPREEWYRENLGLLGAVTNYANRHLPAHAKILMIYEARPYLLHRASVYNTVWDESPLIRYAANAATVDELRAALRADGITHLLVNEHELRRYIQQYARAKQLQPFGLRPGEWMPPDLFTRITPENLYPPFANDPRWEAARPVVLEFLKWSKTNAEVKEETSALSIYLTPI